MTMDEAIARLRELASEALEIAKGVEGIGMVDLIVMTNEYQEEFRRLGEDDDGYVSVRLGGHSEYSFDGGRTWKHELF